MEPGIYELAHDVYLASDGISKHGLDHIDRSPAHYMENKARKSEALAFGSLVHLAVLEPDKFEADVAVAPDVDKRTKAGKEEWEQFSSANKGKHIVKPADWLKAKNMAESVSKHRTAAAALKTGKTEQSVFVDNAGVLCKCRPDFLTDGNAIVDVKTTNDAGIASFARDIVTYRYHVQAAFYLDICRMAGVERETFIFVCVEKEPPFAVATYQLDGESIEQGRLAYSRNLRMYEQCLKTNQWPAYSQDIHIIDLPRWAKRLAA